MVQSSPILAVRLFGQVRECRMGRANCRADPERSSNLCLPENGLPLPLDLRRIVNIDIGIDNPDVFE